MPDHDDDLRAAELKALGASIAAAQPAGVVSATMAFGELTLVAKSESIIEVLTYLRDTPDCLFISFIDLTAVDYLPNAGVRGVEQRCLRGDLNSFRGIANR